MSEPGRLDGHLNAAEHWLQQADIYDFPNPARSECLQLASIHAILAQALATAGAKIRDEMETEEQIASEAKTRGEAP